MILSPGARFGPYEIVSPLGAGGMGEVYRARDTKLGRDIALKFLPELFASDPERLARFDREAKTLATLNHPHIAQIHGLEESIGTRALVMELVEGEDLAQRIARGPMPMDEALAIANQIADALAAAHDQGIIHRDLKPANIKLRPDGTVKVLDFGLAKATALEPLGNAANSPTFSVAATELGVIVGTAAYMAPEQARGKAVDKRADIWAFGCVLYAMLTGAQAFGGETVTDIVGAVVHLDPDWTKLPADVPIRVRRVLKRCLQKDRNARIPDMSAVRFLLDEPADPEAQASAVRATPWRPWTAAALLLAGIATASVATWYVARTAPARAVRFLVNPPEGTVLATGPFDTPVVAVSPDGSRLAFTARDARGKTQLWVRSIDSLAASPLAGTDGATSPAWSPDGAFIAYRAERNVMKIAASGGPPQTLCTGCAPGLGLSWGDGVVLVAGGANRPMQRIAPAGGVQAEYKLAAGQTGQAWPSILPGGRHFLYYGIAESSDARGIYVAALDGGEQKRLIDADSGAVYDPIHKVLLFVREQTLMAQPFDLRALSLKDEAVPVAERVDIPFRGFVTFSVSANGVLAYGMTMKDSAKGLQMVWVDRSGKVLEQAGPAAHYRGIDLAPGGAQVAAHRHDDPGGDIWITELRRGTTTRLTFDASADNSSPIWSPDGRQVAFASLRGGKWGLYRQPANGSGDGEELLRSDSVVAPMSWSPDGRLLVYLVRETGAKLWALPLAGDRKAFALLRRELTGSHGQVSPDGRWLAYQSNETGRDEIYVRPFPSGSGKSQVSTDGGVFARWGATGRELFYMSRVQNGSMMVVDVHGTGSTFDAGLPRRLFETEYINLPHTWNYHTYAVSPDGQRFLIPRPAGQSATAGPSPIAVFLNWKPGAR